MNVLIILANPNSQSFSHRLASIAADTFISQNHTVHVIDLYQDEIALCNDVIDFEHEFSRKDFSYKLNQKFARDHGTHIQGIKLAQESLSEADFVLFQFPLWWFSMPAIMRNWIEKVFTFGFAYNGRERQFFSGGPFKNKRAMLSITTSGSERIYTDQGINGDIMRILWPIHNGILNFTGFKVLPPFISWGSDTSKKDYKYEHEAAFKKRLFNIEAEVPLSFKTLEEFEENYVLKLKDCNVY